MPGGPKDCSGRIAPLKCLLRLPEDLGRPFRRDGYPTRCALDRQRACPPNPLPRRPRRPAPWVPTAPAPSRPHQAEDPVSSEQVEYPFRFLRASVRTLPASLPLSREARLTGPSTPTRWPGPAPRETPTHFRCRPCVDPGPPFRTFRWRRIGIPAPTRYRRRGERKTCSYLPRVIWGHVYGCAMAETSADQ
jgi:hypothetical protein